MRSDTPPRLEGASLPARLTALAIVTTLSWWTGCTGNSALYDFDADGTPDTIDCAPEDETIYPGAPDPFGDGVDSDCSGADGTDADGDGYADPISGGDDCNDSDFTIHPGAEEIADDNIDQDCDEEDLVCDQDGDGVAGSQCDGADCDDGDARCTNNCEDDDGDGYRICDDDCDDGSADRSPANTEVCDGLDNDCDSSTTAEPNELDQDLDGWLTCAGGFVDHGALGGAGQALLGSGDCDDEDSARSPGQEELCDGLDNDCDGGLPADEADADGDGAMPCSGDCDDSDADRFGGKPELCDGVDNDCDGLLPDEEVDADGDGFRLCDGDCDDTDAAQFPGQNWFTDSDGDGFGSGAATLACEQPLNTSPLGTDCDDASPLRFPGNPEICDGLDNDCLLGLPVDELDADGDGVLICEGDCDDEDPMELPGQTWFVDNDGDSFGDDLSAVISCERPPGHVSVGGDCDDDDGTRSPGHPEGCDQIDNDCDGVIPSDELDVDLDGYLPCTGDCDDQDADELPGQTWFPDGDGDGFGNLNIIQVLCLRPTGYITDGGDCDDGSAERFPGNPESCDGLDNDCDSSSSAAGGENDDDLDQYLSCVDAFVDHGASNAAGEQLLGNGDCDDGAAARFPGNSEECDGWDNDCDPSTLVPLGELDLDLDRFLPCGLFVASGATNTSGELLLGGNDCDDGDGLRFPSNPELCDGIDNDCIGSTTVTLGEDDVDLDQHMPCADFVDQGALNGAGAPLLGGDDCDDDEAGTFTGNPELDACDGLDSDCIYDGDEVDDDGDGWFECAGDCDDSEAATFPGNAELDACDGFDNDCVEDLNEVDNDGDGWFECAGDCDDGDPTLSPGLWEDPNDGVDHDCNLTDGNGDQFADVVITGPWLGLGFGASVSAAGDIDGDGLDDILVGSGDRKWVGVFFGAQLMEGRALDFADAAVTIHGRSSISGFGWTVASAGDVDGDGLDDVLIGGNGPGAFSWMFFGATLSAGGNFFDTDADMEFEIRTYGQSNIVGAGDVDGDGLGDVLVADSAAVDYWGLRDQGRVYLFLGSTLQAGGYVLRSDAHAVLVGSTDIGYFGFAMAGGGDVDGDGLDDVLVGEPQASNYRGRAALFFGSSLIAGGTISFNSADVRFDFANLGVDPNGLGASVALLGDIDGDGLSEVVVGGDNSPSSYLFLGSRMTSGASFSYSDEDLALVGTSQVSGSALAGAGDLDGDGRADLLIGDPGDDEAGTDAGATFVLLGSALNAATPGQADLRPIAAVSFVGEGADARSGSSVAGAGDINGDGKDDLLIGTPGWTLGGSTSIARAYLRLSTY